MSFLTTTQDKSAVIAIPSRFDFRSMQEFNEAVDNAVGRASGIEIVIDFTATEYLDSSALGMLLVLRDRARRAGNSVVLARAAGVIRKTLDLANFGKLFAFR